MFGTALNTIRAIDQTAERKLATEHRGDIPAPFGDRTYEDDSLTSELQPNDQIIKCPHQRCIIAVVHGAPVDTD